MSLDVQNDTDIRHDWTVEALREIHDLPLNDLLYRAQGVHRQFHDAGKVQCCTLLSIKTGNCPENCGYCPQSAHYDTEVEGHGLLDVDEVLQKAREAKDALHGDALADNRPLALTRARGA